MDAVGRQTETKGYEMKGEQRKHARAAALLRRAHPSELLRTYAAEVNYVETDITSTAAAAAAKIRVPRLQLAPYEWQYNPNFFPTKSRTSKWARLHGCGAAGCAPSFAMERRDVRKYHSRADCAAAALRNLIYSGGNGTTAAVAGATEQRQRVLKRNGSGCDSATASGVTAAAAGAKRSGIGCNRVAAAGATVQRRRVRQHSGSGFERAEAHATIQQQWGRQALTGLRTLPRWMGCPLNKAPMMYLSLPKMWSFILSPIGSVGASLQLKVTEVKAADGGGGNF
ncbi:hypothetical protein K438DRAFT_1939198 [Mycena galopus ATCC 62051]|nr:hypothetical protein K438DRAFT_1939198 [Mycena galopus ATCC 62051]